ncbi:MAG: ribulose phosphate epimerase [Myxococcota bacterium]
MRPRVHWWLALGVLSGLAWGCGPTVALDTGGADASSSGDDAPAATTTPPPSSTTGVPPATTSVPPATSTTTPPPLDSSSDTSTDDGVGFLDPGLDDGFGGDECDLFAQDCPRGEKCMPWSNDGGGTWNALRCSPIAREPGAAGEPCTVEGNAFSGIDSCELGAMCWDVDEETNEGECIAMCVGSPEKPACEDEGSMCSITGDGVLALCFSTCDPLAQTCPEGSGCYPVGTSSSFACIVDDSGDAGQPADPCMFINDCDPGTMCVPGKFVPECFDLGCCTSFCAVGDMGATCLPGQSCSPYYEEGSAPPGFEDVGVCLAP